MKLCTIDGCDRPAKARGWCGMHWKRWRRHGETGEAAPLRHKQDGVCSAPDCRLPAHAFSLCHTHYNRQTRFGRFHKVKLPYTAREDEELLALPVYPRSGMVMRPHLKDAAERMGRPVVSAGMRRKWLLRLLRQAGQA